MNEIIDKMQEQLNICELFLAGIQTVLSGPGAPIKGILDEE